MHTRADVEAIAMALYADSARKSSSSALWNELGSCVGRSGGRDAWRHRALQLLEEPLQILEAPEKKETRTYTHEEVSAAIISVNV